MSKIYPFIQKLKELAWDVYTINDTNILNKDLNDLNKLYYQIMEDPKITTMEKDYVLSSYELHYHTQIHMGIVPLVKKNSDLVSKKYNEYHNIYQGDMLL